jgi:hypothetical protein
LGLRRYCHLPCHARKKTKYVSDAEKISMIPERSCDNLSFEDEHIVARNEEIQKRKPPKRGFAN